MKCKSQTSRKKGLLGKKGYYADTLRKQKRKFTCTERGGVFVVVVVGVFVCFLPRRSFYKRKNRFDLVGPNSNVHEQDDPGETESILSQE